MSTPQITVAFKHLKKLGLKPVLLPPPVSSIMFQLTRKVTAELFLQSENRQQLLLNLSVTMDTNDSEQLDLFALALAPHLTPVTLTATSHQLILQLDYVTSLPAITTSIEEAIVLSRRVTAITFGAALKLTSQPESLTGALNWAIKQLAKDWAVA